MNYAISKIQPNPEVEESTCSGNVKMFEQGEEDPVLFQFSLSGIVLDESHSISVNTEGGVEGGCSAAGDPLFTWPGANLELEEADGKVNFNLASNLFTIVKDLQLEGKTNILGKSIVVS